MTTFLLELLDKNGGLQRWREVERIDIRLSVTGTLLEKKGFPDGFTHLSVVLWPQAQKVLMQNFPHPGVRGIYAPEGVWTEDCNGRRLSELHDPASSFEGHTRETPWVPLQLLHFLGYSFLNYFSMPFLLAKDEVKTEAGIDHHEHGETWRAVCATFTGRMDTHCKEQQFFFDDEGRLRRHDYSTDLAKGVVAHYTEGHALIDGIWIPLHRHVRSKASDGRPIFANPANVRIDVASILHSFLPSSRRLIPAL